MKSPLRPTILVVEDAESIRRMVCAMLAQSGYYCLEAGDGVEALGVLKNNGDSVNLILTDMLMPNMSGAELAEQVSRNWPKVRIIFMSGYTDDPVVRTIQSSATIFIPKPFTAALLTTKVREVLDHPWTGLSADGSGSMAQ
jgi:two-component system, cell cycle sensor histidine kinase and response regulator CckA